MSTFKRAKVVMLPTEKSNKVGDIVLSPDNKRLATINVLTVDSDQPCTNQHLYILSDDEIKEDDWYIDDANQIRQSITSDKEYWKARKDYKKIIATTNNDCYFSEINDGSNCAYPQPSQSFIKKYVEEYNKGNMITDVLVEYEAYSANIMMNMPIHYCLKIKNNTITIKKVKDSWSREEVIEIIMETAQIAAYENWSGNGSTSLTDVQKWIKDNL